MNLDHRLLWSTRTVRERLRQRTLTDSAVFGYFLAIMGFDWLQFTLIATTPSAALPPWSLANSWATLAITVSGLPYLFWRNGAGRGRDFLQRYFPLSVSVGWKFVVAMFVAMWLLPSVLTGHDTAVQGWSATATLAALNLAMFWRIGHHLRLLARTTGS